MTTFESSIEPIPLWEIECMIQPLQEAATHSEQSTMIPPSPPPQQSNPMSGTIRIDAIRCTDVLNGRGNGVKNLPGNIEFRSLVKANASCYSLTHHKEEMDRIVIMIREQIENRGGRFLALDDGGSGYQRLNSKEVTIKIKQALRDANRKRKQCRIVKTCARYKYRNKKHGLTL